jgi:hypothetical protein
MYTGTGSREELVFAIATIPGISSVERHPEVKAAQHLPTSNSVSEKMEEYLLIDKPRKDWTYYYQLSTPGVWPRWKINPFYP